MDDWRNQILKEFTPQVSRLTLVADPDGLLTEEGVLQGLRERGFELIPFEDPIAFRFAYESKYRSRWDSGETTELVVVLRAERDDLNSLPFDLLNAGRKLYFSLGDIFPNLSYPVIQALDRADLDALYKAQFQYRPDKLGDNATKDFVLLHVFEIEPKLIKHTSDLLKALLRKHFRNLRIPVLFDDRFLQVLKQKDAFATWPLEQIVYDRNAFFGFLQERWPAFLDKVMSNSKEMSDGKDSYGLKMSGPLYLPFDHDDIRVYIDSLFLEGLLSPVSRPEANKLSKSWVSVGLQIDADGDRLRRLEGLGERIKSSLPSSEAKHQDWLDFAFRWAEFLALLYNAENPPPRKFLGMAKDLQKEIDERFYKWVVERYAGLYNQPPVPPVMVHHIVRAMAREVSQFPDEKVALIVMDGLALDQWIILRDVLAKQRPKFAFREHAVFAWIPTVTSVSRQSQFAGKPPLYFPSSINTTSKEASLWFQFWLDKGLNQTQIAYMKGLGNGKSNGLKEMAENTRVRVAGVIVDKVDKIMHGMELGTQGMHNQVRQWVQQGHLANIIDLLGEQKFNVWLTSDHGNIEADGIGRPSEGAIADTKGERVRVYPDHGLRTQVKAAFPESIEWPAIGLPDNYLPLIAQGRSAFIPEGKKTVAHGGISIEEVIVPLIEIATES
jgi:hypothetical protein